MRQHVHILFVCIWYDHKYPFWFAYCVRLNSNPEIAKEVNALEEVTKAGSVTIGKNICLYQARIGQGKIKYVYSHKNQIT